MVLSTWYTQVGEGILGTLENVYCSTKANLIEPQNKFRVPSIDLFQVSLQMQRRRYKQEKL